MHFFGIVFSDGTASVDDLMEPYSEDNAEQFVPAGEFERSRWEDPQYKTRMLRLPDGSLESAYSEKFFEISGGKHVEKYPEGSEVVEMPLCEAFASYDEFLSEWFGYELNEQTGEYGYWGNPQGKWDYWRVGGRARGWLKASTGQLTELSWEFTFNADEGHRDAPGRFDIALVDDLAKYKIDAPYFAVTPDGQWLEASDWGGGNRAPGARRDASEIAADNRAFWDAVVEPLRGKGCTAYVVDAHG